MMNRTITIDEGGKLLAGTFQSTNATGMGGSNSARLSEGVGRVTPAGPIHYVTQI